MPEEPASVRFDHFVSYIAGRTLDQELERYRSAGFAVADLTVKHEPGLRTGFVYFGDLYIEFAWVEDETRFAAGTAEEAAYRNAHRPWGIGLVSSNVQALHKEWARRGYELPDVFSKAPRDAPPDAAPAWSFQEIPQKLLAGASCFVLTYHIRLEEISRPPASNSTYGIVGPILVADNPQQRATAWRDLLAPGGSVRSSEQGHQLEIGPNVATWLSPAAYRSRFGLEWVPAPHPCGELALLHVLAADLQRAKSALELAGWTETPVEGGIFVPPSPIDGFSFLITQARRET